MSLLAPPSKVSHESGMASASLERPRPETHSPSISGAEGPATGARIAQVGEARSARVESLRALAALSVMVSHAFVLSYGLTAGITDGYLHRVALEAGFGGVDFFFVLSGYLLFWPFARSAFATGEKVDLRRYALNRAVRILPLYYVVLATLLVIQHHGGSWGQWWRFGLFVENFSSSTLNTIDIPMWSLAVEVQFYVALPLLALMIARLSRGSRSKGVVILVVLGLASVALRQALVWHSAAPHYGWQFSLPSVFFFFAAGMMLALLRVGWIERRPRWLDGRLGSSDVWFLGSVPLWALVCWRLSYEPATALAAVLTIGACVLPLRSGRFVGAVEGRGLSRLGLASYSLYLCHFPIMIAIASGDLTGSRRPRSVPTTTHFVALLAISAVLCTVFALYSYTLFEAPPLRLRRRWAGSLPPAV